MTTLINVENIGPVIEFEYVMEAPGLHVLRGPQGAGKTTILRTVQLALGAKVDVRPSKRDGTARGSAEVAGRTIRIAKQVREEGDLSVEGLGDLDIGELHWPHYQDASTRDRHRIATMVRLAGVAAEPSLFYGLAGGKATFEAAVVADAVRTDDLVEMASRIKRAFERAAQAAEGRAEMARANAAAQIAAAEGIDIADAKDDQELRRLMQEAIERRSSLRQKRSSAIPVLERAAMANERLKEIEMPDVPSADRSALLAKHGHDAAVEALRRLESELPEARREVLRAADVLMAAESARREIGRHKETLDAWRSDVAAAEGVDCPSEADLAMAEKDTEAATKAVEQGMRVRQAIIARDQAKKYSAQARTHDDEAVGWRDAARGTMDILSDSITKIDGCPLTVSSLDGDARLVLATDRSKSEAFDELSDGERWPIIVKLAAARNRLVVLPQAAFGELSDATRRIIHQVASEVGCYVLTAQADDGLLRAEPWSEPKP